jgi:UDP-glucuronate 4-epimerase
MRILITGGAGFVGAHVSKLFKEQGHDVKVIDNYSPYYSVHLKEQRALSLLGPLGIKVEFVDISDYESVSRVVKEFAPQYVVNLAAQAGVRLPISRMSDYISSNISGFLNVVRSAIENGVQGILYASSSSVYGDSSPAPFEEQSPLLSPKSFYGITKLSNEHTARVFATNSGMSFRGVRFFTVYGEWGRPDMAYFRIAASALGKGTFTLFGDGAVERDFTYIDDVTKSVYELVMELENRPSGFNDIVNIGGSRPLSMNYLISTIEKATGSTIQKRTAAMNPVDSKKTVASPKYLESLIGPRQFTPLEVGIERMLAWFNERQITDSLNSWIESTI